MFSSNNKKSKGTKILAILIGIALSLFLIVTVQQIVRIKNGETLGVTQTPTNTAVATQNDTDLDICKVYRDNPERLDDTTPVEGENIQPNIGYQNNKFGLYIYRIDDFAIKAAEMVNSNGGDWGYVLIPYNVKDYDNGKWNDFFQILNERHLIPIIQLWDVSKDPQDAKRDTRKSAQFLNSLNWPTTNRYISVYNEVNDEKFWKDGINPEGYAELLDYTIETYKRENFNFFMLNGAFNASARTGGGYLDEYSFLVKMNQQVPGIFTKLDGWASHPYPHVGGYLGTPNDSGRNSIRAYEWELNILETEFGVKDLPVFITETGWPHAEGKNHNPNYVTEQTAANYLKQAFENVWLPDKRVVAVTPFTIKYDPPYDHFSFIKSNGDNYKVFDVIKDMNKQQGTPPLNQKVDQLKEYCKKQLQ